MAIDEPTQSPVGFFDPKRPMALRRQAVVNLWDFLVRGGIADLTRTPSDIIDRGRTREVHRYQRVKGIRAKGVPVLLVPPLGSQAACFDLRKGLSLAEDFVGRGRPTYLVDYGPLKGEDGKVGIEHFINDVLPPAIRAVSEDAGGRDVHLVGWCMGGLLSIGTTAIYDDLPIRSVAMVASPFDMSNHPILKPVQAIGKVTGGRIIGTALKAAGIDPGTPGQPRVQGDRADDLPEEAAHPVDQARGPRVPRPGPGRRRDHEQHARLPRPGHAAGLPADGPAQRAGHRQDPGSEPPGRPRQRPGPGHERRRGDRRAWCLSLLPITSGRCCPTPPTFGCQLAPGGHLGVLTGTKAPEHDLDVPQRLPRRLRPQEVGQAGGSIVKVASIFLILQSAVKVKSSSTVEPARGRSPSPTGMS